MKQIPRIPLDGAVILSPSEMNGIHFETGLHTATAPRNSGAKGSNTSTKPTATVEKD